MENKQTVTVIGAGLAGSECAWQLAQRGISGRLRRRGILCAFSR